MSIDRSVAVGVEIAGSRATVALIDRHGRILHRCQVKTLWGRPASATLEPYFRAVDLMLVHAHTECLQMCGVGVSVPGALDSTSRRPLSIPTLPSLNGVPLCDLLEARYGLPTLLHVDVDAAVLGEHRFGAGQGFSRLLLLTVNAVVGASLVVDGQVERSELHGIGHVCHLPVSTSGPRCGCGKRGCINTLISNDAMQKMVQRALRRGEESSLTQRILNREYFSPQLLAEEARRGDNVALQVYSEVGRWLGAAISKYLDLFEPDALILGGGTLHANELLLTQIRNAVVPPPSSRVSTLVELLSASLGNDAIVVGTVVSLF